MTILFDPHPGKFKTWREACTYAYIQVMKQGRASLKNLPKITEPACAYRGENGCKCFVGHIMPDSKYRGSFEDMVVNFPAVWDAVISSVVEESTVKTPSMLSALQSAHDNAKGESPEEFRESFRQRADRIFEDFGWPVPEVTF